ncbi:amidohydrolase [Limnothrix sp. FACHB-881]|uniref:M20 metallopeptidase family protein n=1 Tax=Limnothrix sp. FACHB-881 TaxID=2692819 RepID=UPI00168717CA|nr:amidohydrolase [Limnothrix sp. FACHB-881]
MISTLPTAPGIDLSKLRLDVRNLLPQLVSWRRQFHQYPELGFQEALTAAFVCDRLREWGIDYQAGIAKTGIVAVIEGSQPGPTIALRADMDALPVQEQNEVPYRSRHEGKMHACGHDGHTAIALGTAYYLAHHRSQLAGTIKLIFQPAEEGPGGAKPMIEAGVLHNPDVDAIFGLHLWNNLPLGTVGVRPGPLMAAVELFACTLFGKGGHGAMPHQTIDSVLVGAQIVTALQTIVARNIDPIDSAVVTVGEFHAGTAKNVIADQARLAGTVRYFNPALEGVIRERVESIIAGICAAHGARYELDYRSIYPATVNDPAAADRVRQVAETVIETPIGVVPNCQTMGGEDMSFFLKEVPGCYFFVGAANPDRGLAFPHHHPRFDFDETALAMGVELFLRIIESFNTP